MQVNISTSTLREALGKILSIVSRKSSRHLLTCIYFNTEDDKLTLTATDLEVSAKVHVDAQITGCGNFCVNAKNIFDIVRVLPEEIIHLEIDTNENTLKLGCKNILYSVLIYKSDDFPTILFSNEQIQFELDSSQVMDIINKTSHAISTDETRPFLNGIFLQEVDSKLRSVATDGFCLSLYDIEFISNTIDTLVNGIIVPRKGIYELKKLADTYSSDKIKISVDDAFLYASANDNYFLSIRLIARDYPKYQTIIPGKTNYSAVVDRNILLDAIRRINIMSNERSNGVKLCLDGGELTVCANNPDLGGAFEKISMIYKGKSMEIAFNAKYLIDTLLAFEEGDIELELNNELSPVILKSNNLPQFLSIVMPFRLQ